MSDRPDGTPEDFSGLIPGADRPRRGRRGGRDGRKGAAAPEDPARPADEERQSERQSERSGELADTTDASIQFEQDGALQTQSATDEPVTHRDDSPARKSATDTGVTEANAAEGDGPEAPGDAAPAEPPTGQEAPARYDPPFEQARTNAGARGAAKSPTARTKSRKKPTAAQPGVLGESGGTPRALPDGRVTPMAVREEPVVPSHYTLPESHTIVVDEIRAVLRRPPYRYTKRQASQSNVVAIAIERLYEDITGEPMPRYSGDVE